MSSCVEHIAITGYVGHVSFGTGKQDPFRPFMYLSVGCDSKDDDGSEWTTWYQVFVWLLPGDNEKTMSRYTVGRKVQCFGDVKYRPSYKANHPSAKPKVICKCVYPTLVDHKK